MPQKSEETPQTWTIRRVLQWTQQRFTERGLPSPRLDAELLLCHSLGKPRVALYTGFDQPLSADELASYRQLIRRRLEGEPVAYLTGKKDFWSLTLHVTPDVLVPRPETETLVEVALSLLPSGPAAPSPAPDPQQAPDKYQPGAGELSVHYEPDTGESDEPAPQAPPVPPAAHSPAAGAVIADIGTGSGAVALALASERPGATVYAVDCSPAALEVARGNATKLGLSVQFLLGDLLQPLSGLGPFDLIVSNPPYIPTADIPGLQPEVRTEPVRALDGGPDGLAVIRRLIDGAPHLLAPGVALAMEVGAGQAQEVAALLRQRGFAQVALEDDLARIPRVVSGRWLPA